MNMVEIERRSCADAAYLTEFFAPPTRRPLILTDAFDHWPARRKWSFDFFSDHCGSEHGTVPWGFSSVFPSKLTTLGAYIGGIDQPLEDLGGFWIDADGTPVADMPELSPSGPWGFVWRSFKKSPDLYEDIAPFPAFVPNSLASEPVDVLRQIGKISGRDLHSIYIGRRGTMTPFHVDFFHTFGSLFQFEGRKKVWLIAPTPELVEIPDGFDPEEPDPDEGEPLNGIAILHATLEPGECVIMPPDWWHCTKAMDHSITLSCNFFNKFNASEFMPCLRQAAEAIELQGEIRALMDRLEGEPH